MTGAPRIAVALATCNGAEHLPALLQSLFAQSRQDFRIVVGDDVSTDRTVPIVEDYGRAFPGRIEMHRFDRRIGPSANFSRLLARIDADFILLSDQDDVWLPRKIEMTVDRLIALETSHGAQMPALVHTDLCVVDRELATLHPSAARYLRIDFSRSTVPALLFANRASGCSIGINRALAGRALPVPTAAVMHDHWLALTAAAIGRVSYIDQATLLYRQHEANAIGADGWTMRSILQRIRQTLLGKAKRDMLQRYADQASALLNRHGAEMVATDRAAAQAAASVWRDGRIRRLRNVARRRVRMDGCLRTLGLIAALLREPAGSGAGSTAGMRPGGEPAKLNRS